MKNKLLILLWIPFVFGISSCNYNYHQGMLLEEKGQFEGANIEYYRAYISSPGSSDFKEAYERTAKKTVVDLLERYQGYIHTKKYRVAYARLEQASNLEPANPTVIAELKKWTQVLVAGKLELDFKSLKDQVSIKKEMKLVVVINSPDREFNLIADVDHLTQTFQAVDHVYQANIRAILNYNLNSIGIQLKGEQYISLSHHKFVDLQRAQLGSVSGSLKPNSTSLTPVASRYPIALLQRRNVKEKWIPSPRINFNATLSGDKVLITKTDRIDFLPQMIYLNQQDHRLFLDFGHLQVSQKTKGGKWFLQRWLDPKRSYMKELEANILLDSFFQFREGAYAVVTP